MSLFSKRKTIYEKQKLTVGEFDINVDGAYRNVKALPVEGKKGRKLFVSVKSDSGVDVSIVDAKGVNEKFKEAVTDSVISVPILEKGTMSLIFGVYRGNLANVEFEVWME